ncbi:hypothetical protein EDB83DRAFT_2311970 [Lactarius deliciosus]|nr:hypothetical protein EDB83DRAFT_2311970 [Lactarius deliciosus]
MTGRWGVVRRVGTMWWGLARCVEVAWQVSGVLACRVGLARWVDGGSVAGQDGGGMRARMACNLQAEGLVCCVGTVRWVGGGGVSRQDGGGSHARMACNVQAGWWWRRVASHVRVACWGGDKW